VIWPSEGCCVSTAVIHTTEKSLKDPRKPLLSSVQPAGDKWSTFFMDQECPGKACDAHCWGEQKEPVFHWLW
jgi:hypothetical protein